MVMRPMSPVRLTWVPPHSSIEKVLLPSALPMETTRTSSPYFSPKSARAPDSMASSTAMSLVTTGSFWSSTALAMSSTALELPVVDGLGVAEVEAQAVGRHERALLGDVIAEHLAQSLVQEVRRGMVGRARPSGARDPPSSSSD